MIFSALDEHAARRFATDNWPIVEGVIPASGKAAESDDLFGMDFQLSYFIDFCKAIAAVGGTITAVPIILQKVSHLFQWARGKDVPPLDVRERLLVSLFDVYVHDYSGLMEAELVTRLKVDKSEVSKVLKQLESIGVVRLAPDGSWKYKGSR